MNKIVYLFLLVSLIFACQPQSALKIEGQITDASNINVYFDRLGFSGTANVITNTQTDANGNFEMKFEEPLDAGIYRIRVGAKNAMLYLDETDKLVKLNGDMNSLSNMTYELSGSDNVTLLYDSFKKMRDMRTPQEMTQFIEQGNRSIVNSFLGLQAFRQSSTQLPLYKSLEAKLKAEHPNSEYTKEMEQMVKAIESSAVANQRKYKFKVGDVAPDIVMEDPNGKTRKLSDLKGKVVLIDFWASWCGPCRKANPHVVEVYDEYKSKGFDVFSVSLDGIHPKTMQRYGNDPAKIAQGKEQAKNKWIQAIKKDNLKWDNHVSELAHWGSKINKVYGISSIPTTYLIDREGKIAAVNPRGNLEEAVKAAL